MVNIRVSILLIRSSFIVTSSLGDFIFGRTFEIISHFTISLCVIVEIFPWNISQVLQSRYTWSHAGLMTIGLLLAGAQITLFHFYYQLDNLGRFEYLYGLLTIFWLHYQNLLDALSRALDPQHAYEWSRINQESGGIAEIFYRLENYLDLLTRNLDSMQKNPYRVVSKHIGKYQQ